MNWHEQRAEDERLRELFHELRSADEREAPPFRSLRWVRESFESRPTRMRRLAAAGLLATVVTAVLAGIAVGPRWWGSKRPLLESTVAVRKYVPPPPSVERSMAESSFIVGDPAPPPPSTRKARRLSMAAAPTVEAAADERRRIAEEGAALRAVAEEARRMSGGPAPAEEWVRVAQLERPSEAPEAGAASESSKTFADEYISNLPVQGRFHTNVLTLAGGTQDSDVERERNVQGARERHFATTVGGVANVPPSEAQRTLRTALGMVDREPMSAESYAAIEENPFHVVADEPLSTFSVDVDTASYSNVRRFVRSGRRPPRDAVRVEELINYFTYDAVPPGGDDPFGVAVEVADCPWNRDHRLARITLAARREGRQDYAGSNLVFLLDVSGSMRPPNKLPLVKQAMSMLADQLDGRDSVSIVVYAGASGLVLPPTAGSDRAAILESLGRLEAGGSTAGASGLRLAYETARENFIEGGVNRVILATDGDFNVGVTGHAELLRIIEKDARRGVFLTALGFGMGNYQDDRLEQLADRGNGNYAYIDDLAEARKVLVEEIGGTLVTVAKDVKLQVEFNPKEVGAYRLIGYENRLLAHRDFNDDTKDAGEIGAGHTVTVLYELVPPGEAGTDSEVDPLRYQRETEPTEAAGEGELFTLKIRFKPPHGSQSRLRTYPVRDDGLTIGSASDDFRFAAAVAAFGMRLREAESVRDYDWNEIERLAAGATGIDEHGHRAAFLTLVRQVEEESP